MFRLAAFLAASPWILPLCGGTLAVRILDENGAPTPARVYLRDSTGHAWLPEHAIVYRKARPEAAEEHFVPPTGSFQLVLPAGAYTLEVEKGKEYLPVRLTLQVPAEGSAPHTVRLKRWIRMAARGWYSGDMHPHRPLADMPALMEADDLNVALPITRWRRTGPQIDETPGLPEFLARADEAGVIALPNQRWLAVLNEELEPRASALLVSHLGRRGTALQYPLAVYGMDARRRGALVDSEKATSLELPAIAAVQGCDLVGLANNHFWRSGYYAGPWGAWPDGVMRAYPRTCAGFALAGFDIYYALLNMGFPLKLSAGSASGVHPVPLAWSRIYAHVPPPFSIEKWFAAVRAGRSFVTTGPLLLLEVSGHTPGDEIPAARLPFAAPCSVRVLSPRPVHSAEVVVNGRPTPVPLEPEPGSPNTYRGAVTIPLRSSAWIAARWLEARDGGCDVAHTSPLYVRSAQAGIPVPREDAEYLLRRVERLIEVVRSGGSSSPVVMDSPSLRQQTLDLLDRARNVYLEKLRNAEQ